MLDDPPCQAGTLQKGFCLLVITGALSTHVRSVTRRYAEELRHRKEVAEEEDEEVDDKLGEPSVRR